MELVHPRSFYGHNIIVDEDMEQNEYDGYPLADLAEYGISDEDIRSRPGLDKGFFRDYVTTCVQRDI